MTKYQQSVHMGGYQLFEADYGNKTLKQKKNSQAYKESEAGQYKSARTITTYI
jgi:hypothetical protein